MVTQCSLFCLLIEVMIDCYYVQESGLAVEAERLITRVTNRSLATVDDWSALQQYVVGKGDIAMPILSEKNALPTIVSMLTDTRGGMDRTVPLPAQTSSIACWLLEHLSDDITSSVGNFMTVMQAVGTSGQSQFAMVTGTLARP